MSPLDLGNLTPNDAVAALKSFPRRYGEVLQPPSDADAGIDADERARRPGPDGASALAIVAEVVGTWASLADALRRVAVSDEPVFDASPSGSTRPVPNVAAAGVELEEGAQALATQIADVPGDSWGRAGTSADGTRVTALELVHQAVAEGRQGLDRMTRALAAVDDEG